MDLLHRFSARSSAKAPPTYRPQILFQVQAGVLIILTIGLVVGLSFGFYRSLPPVILGMAAALVSYWLNRIGRTQTAALVMMLCLLAMQLLLLFAGQGVHDITMIVLPIILVMSSLLLNRSSYLFVVVLTIVGATSVAVLEMNKTFVTETSFTTNLSDPFLLAAILILTAGVVRLLADSLINSLADAQRRLAHLTALNQVSAAITSWLDLDTVLTTLHEHIQAVAPNHAFSVALYNHASTELSFPIFIDLGQKVYVPPSEIREQPGLTGEVIARRAPLYLPDLHDPQCLHGLEAVQVGSSAVRTYLGLPLILQDEVIGVMSIQSELPDAYNSDQISLLETIAAQAAIALEKSRLYAALHTELQERRLIEDDLHRRDSILEAVSLAAGKFLTGADWRGGIRTVLARLGQETGALQAAICSLDDLKSTAAPNITVLYDWSAPGAIFNPQQIYPHAARQIDGLERWLAATRLGDLFTARLFPLEDHQPQSVSVFSANSPIDFSSHLTAPIRVSGELWGFIDFEAGGEKVWSEVEIEAIQVAAGLLGAAIARQRDDEQIHRLNAELEGRVRERTADLESFAYSVAHDLRAPLRGIDGYSKLLLEDYGERLEGDGSIYLQNVRRAAQWMGQIIDDLLKLSRVTRVEMRLTRVDLSQIATEIAAQLNSQCPHRKVCWTIQPGLTAKGDPNLLRLVFENLLHNGWKFTDRRDEAVIEIGRMGFNPGAAENLEFIPSDAVLPASPAQVYYVRDNGAGFDMNYAGKLFTPFQRLHTSDEFDGSGVGLATVRRILRRHNGDIWVQSARDRGACFYFTLPD